VKQERLVRLPGTCGYRKENSILVRVRYRLTIRSSAESIELRLGKQNKIYSQGSSGVASERMSTVVTIFQQLETCQRTLQVF
jgi:hypothetical protein